MLSGSGLRSRGDRMFLRPWTVCSIHAYVLCIKSSCVGSPSERQFTRPPELIKGRPPVEEDLVEYEMDLDDEKWLADWNQHNPGTLIEVDDFELYLDRLEKARARPAPRGPR